MEGILLSKGKDREGLLLSKGEDRGGAPPPILPLPFGKGED